MIDFALQLNWDYCLINAEWDHQIGYAKAKWIGLFLWYNSAGSWNRTPQMPRDKRLTKEGRRNEFALLKKMVIVGIKANFFAGDGQFMLSYYEVILEDEAQFGLMVNCYGVTLPQGLLRTYPKLITAEAVKGFENVVAAQYNAARLPIICCILLFTRNLFDPMDYTPTCFQELPSVKRRTSNVFELTLAILFQSGIQPFVELPEGLAFVPTYVKEFLREVPANWEDICFIDSSPGQYFVLARGPGSSWHVAGINALKT